MMSRRIPSSLLSFVFPARDVCYRRYSTSSKRWVARQRGDAFTREAKVQQFKSRAAFKLLEVPPFPSSSFLTPTLIQLNEKYHIFRPGQTVLDLVNSPVTLGADIEGFAPGSWTQVAVSKTQPNGRVLGIDILPCPAPAGSSAMQGNFLSKATQSRIKAYFSDPLKGRAHNPMIGDEIGYIDMAERDQLENPEKMMLLGGRGVVDVVLSDMSEPWPQTEGFWKNYLTEAYFRMMNVTGIRVKDHGDSMVPIPTLSYYDDCPVDNYRIYVTRRHYLRLTY